MTRLVGVDVGGTKVAVAVLENGHRVVGYCFTPQDGNSLLSSVAMTLRYLYPKEWEQKMAIFDRYLFREV